MADWPGLSGAMNLSSVPIRRISFHQPAIVAARYGLTNALLVAFLAALIAGGWYLWIAIGVTALIGGVADELAGDDRRRLSAAVRWYYEANLYLTLPLISLITFVYLHYLTAADPLGL